MPPTIVSTGLKLGQAIISNGFVTGNKWSNPDNLLLSDGDLAESNVSAGVASDVIVGNFLSQVPNNAIVTGFEIQIIGKQGAQTTPALALTPVAVDDTSGSNLYYPGIPLSLTQNLASYIIGSQNYQFNTAWSADQANNFKLQLIADGDISVDCVLLNIFYYIPSTPTNPINPTGGCADCNGPIQAPFFTLALPFKAGDRYAYLTSMNYAKGDPILFTDLGSCGGYLDLTFDPALRQVNGGNFEENCQTAIWITLPNGQVQLDFGASLSGRGIQNKPPYTSDASLRSDHDANSRVVLSNSAAFENRMVRTCQKDFVFSPPITVDNQGVPLADPLHEMDFEGNGVIVTNDILNSNKKIVTIQGPSGTNPPQITNVISGSSGNIQVPSISANLIVSGLNRGAIVEISTEQAKTITSVTVGGVPCTQKVALTDTPNNLRSEIWVCVNPPLGSQPVVVTLSGPAYISFGAECVAQIDTSNPVGNTQNASGNSGTPSLVLTTSRDNSLVIDSLTTAKTPILYTPGAGQGLNWALTANGDTRQGGSSVEQAGLEPDAVTMDYSMTQSTPWVYTAIEINGITVAPNGVQSVTDDGNGVVDVDNTDPNNPIVKFNGVNVDGSTITGDGSAGNPLVAHSGGASGVVKVDIADTTPGYLDPKLNIHSSDASVSITKTITNPAGNEVLDYNLTVVGGGGGSGGGLFTNGITTYSANTPSGVQTIPHGLGTIPKKIRLQYFCLDSVNSNLTLFATAVYNGAIQSSESFYGNGLPPRLLDQTFTLNNSNNAGTAVGIVTFDATNIYISWTKSSSPTGDYQVIWEAETGGGGTDIQTFNTSGTWTKPAGAKSVEVVCIGAGGGGTTASGGNVSGAGGGGAFTKNIFNASMLGATETITVGVGGTHGVNGGNSSFGSWLKAGGGSKGASVAGGDGGGSIDIGVPAPATSIDSIGGQAGLTNKNAEYGGGGGGSQTIGGGTSGGSSIYGAGGGGGGGNSGGAGGAGGTSGEYTNGGGGAGGAGNSTNPGSNGADGSSIGKWCGEGGGGGGSQAFVAGGGLGGDGGFPGGGGGGGGWDTHTGIGSDGGKGGDGQITIITYF